MYAVIMAGGGGTRLHPLSRPERPKPFLPLLPSGETLLQATARRLPVGPHDVTGARPAAEGGRALAPPVFGCPLHMTYDKY
jgi:hypothetical protein